MSLRWSAAAVVVSLLAWRQGRVSYNTLVYPSGLTPSFYEFGRQGEKCDLVVSKDERMTHCEDAILWEHNVIMSCDPSRPVWNTIMGPLKDPSSRGSLWLHSKGSSPREILLDGYPKNADFHPLGIDIFDDGRLEMGEPASMFVINHGRVKSTIEFFKIFPARPSRAIYMKTIHHPSFVSPNSLVATGRDSFYISNDHHFTRRLPVVGGILPMVETVFGIPGGNVLHVSVGDTVNSTVAIGNIPFANGIAMHGNILAVACTSMSKVYFYEKGPGEEDESLTLKHTVHVPFSPDNLSFDDKGRLVVAGHPHFPSVIAVSKGQKSVSPSWVAVITPKGSDGTWTDAAPVLVSSRVPTSSSHDIRTIYQSNGAGFSSSSSALIDNKKGKYYMTGLYADGLLECDMKNVASR